jgi:class 3 adenylate cyclase/tetratricopeptide (TPR) repeat protein
VEQIVRSRAALEGERKQITILFADLRGSMELLAGRDPEDARRLLDPVLELMIDAVHRFEGTVNQVMGDGIMALFGAPVAHEDHAVRACYAGLLMQESIERHARALRQQADVDVKIRIGINSGEVVVRAIGGDLRMDYTAVGESTHIAARLEQRAEPGTILVTAHTARLADGYVDLEPLTAVSVKGLREPLTVYRLTGARTVRSRLDVSAARGFTPFVARGDEFSLLQQALDAASSGHGQVVAMVGEAGVGKSRLLWEFVGGPRAAGWLVLEASALPYGVDYLPVTTLIRACLGLRDRDEISTVRGTVQTALAGQAVAHLRSPLLALLDVPVEDEQWHALDTEARHRRAVDAVSQLLVMRSRVQPVCVVVEDLHWADTETRAVLEGLMDALPASRVALLVTYRPEFEHGWSGKSFYRHIRVDPLSTAQADRLLLQLVGSDPELAALRALLVERTEGNPFFLEESIRNLVETGALAGTPGAYRLAATAGPAIPDSVHAVLAARIDRLSLDDKRVLETASALGRDVALPLLRAVVDVREDVLELSLARLRTGEFLYQTSFDADTAYRFKHALTLDVAYAGLISDRRRALDARIVDALERLYPERNAERLDRLAHHAQRGEVWEKAVIYYREAGARAFARSAHRAAAGYFERAMSAQAHLADTREAIQQAIDIRLDLRYALGPLAEYGRLLEVLSEAEALARKLDDPRRLARVSAFLANYFILAGKLDRAIEHGERARRLGEHIDDPPCAAVTHAFLAAAYYAKGDYRRAAADAGRNVERLVGGLERERFGMTHLTSVYSRTIMAWSLAELGEFERAAAAAADGLRIAEAAEHPYSVVFALLGSGTVQLRRGELGAAIATLERAWTLCDEVGLVAGLLEVTGPLASAFAQFGRADDAIALLQRVIARPAAARHAFGRLLRTAGLGEAYVCAGRPAEALPLAAKFLEAVQPVQACGLEAWAWRLVAECATRLEPADRARAEHALDAGLALANELGMRPLAARCHLTRAELLRRTGRADDAAAAATTASELFSLFGMTRWKDLAERMLA